MLDPGIRYTARALGDPIHTMHSESSPVVRAGPQSGSTFPVGGDCTSERLGKEVVSQAMNQSYAADAPARQEIDAMPGSVVVEFGTNWCGICAAAQRSIRAAFADYPGVRHIKIEDGPGRPTGRSFRVKLWPTLVFLSDGKEVARVVRPSDAQSVSRALAELAASSQSDG